MEKSAIKRTPMEAWIAGKIACSGTRLSRKELAAYQLQKLRETIACASLHSPFYRKKLGGKNYAELKHLSDLERLPFTTNEELRQWNLQFLCVSQSEINRVVTLSSSGTTGNPKRIFFTADDQELAIDFFQCGTSNLVEKGERVLVLLPGQKPGSMGELLAEGVLRFGAEPIRHGMIHHLDEALHALVDERANAVIGLPVQVLALARYAEAAGASPRLRSVALVSDHVPDCLVTELKRLWHCDVFQHYGSTEMGLGGGVDCQAHAGYHLREADLYFEIIDPQSGAPVAEGEPGEVVFTTLTRRGMPLIRYRIGDISRMIPEPCACGSVLRRMQCMESRDSVRIALPGNHDAFLTMAMLDEVLFKVPGVIDFDASISRRGERITLTITAQSVYGAEHPLEKKIIEALHNLHVIDWMHQAATFAADINVLYGVHTLEPRAEKRMIRGQDCDGEQSYLSNSTR
jgi:phenylacetate-CoA ligase